MWGRNVFDEDYVVRGFFFGNEPPDWQDKRYVQLGEPRQFGVTARWEFSLMRTAWKSACIPLDADYIPSIKAFIDRLNTYPELQVTTNAMSTQIAGEHARLFEILAQGNRDHLRRARPQGVRDEGARRERLSGKAARAASRNLALGSGAALLGLAYLLLAVRRNLLCWLCAFISTAIYLVLFARAALYMQSLLQVFYLVMAVYGFIDWRKGRTDDGEVADSLVDSDAARTGRCAVVVASVVNGWLLAQNTDAAAPYLDSFVTWGSVVTTWMVARRVIENWLYWIVVDAVAAWLYFTQGLLATTLLFVIYLGIVVRGYFVWRREQAATAPRRSRCVMQTSGDAPAQVAAVALGLGVGAIRSIEPIKHGLTNEAGWCAPKRIASSCASAISPKRICRSIGTAKLRCCSWSRGPTSVLKFCAAIRHTACS